MSYQDKDKCQVEKAAQLKGIKKKAEKYDKLNSRNEDGDIQCEVVALGEVLRSINHPDNKSPHRHLLRNQIIRHLVENDVVPLNEQGENN